MKKNRRDFPRSLSDSVVEGLRDFFADRSEVLLAYLFGSYLTRTKGPVHDIDIAVYVHSERFDTLDHEKPYGYEASMILELTQLLKYDSVDFVVLNNGSPLLQREVISKGRLIFCGSEKDRIHFETYALKRYADTAHLRRIKRLYMKKRLHKGFDAYA